MFSLRLLAWAAALPLSALAAPVVDYVKDSDLETYITRPDLRMPKFKIKTQDLNAVAPGYWFVAPYVDLKKRLPSRAYQPGQTGPAIYDNQGNLVWSGADMFGDRTAFDFRMKEVNGTQYLSFILDHEPNKKDFTTGAGVILNAGYEVVENVVNVKGNGIMNMHEFNILEAEGGNTALTITFDPTFHDFSKGQGKGPYGWVGNNGFQETDIRTGEIKFQWWALDHVDVTDSFYKMGPYFPGNNGNAYDFFHMNSVDKNADGDYLISARYMNCIYKISGRDGSIIWSLGGPKSSFTLSGFNFSSQHDARFRKETGDITEISLMNNAANSEEATADVSSAMIVSLNHKTMEATLKRDLQRPDQSLSRLRGNVQELPNGNNFVCWSENAYISEFDSKDRLVLEAQFDSHRFVNYRAYKFNFKGSPKSQPVVKAHAYGVTPSSSTTAFYISWNGATEVTAWKFYGSEKLGKIEDFLPLGTVNKEGFETEFMVTGYVTYSFAEAISADGEVLGRSPVIKAEIPAKWQLTETEDSDADEDEDFNPLIKNPPEPRRDCLGIQKDSINMESVSNWTTNFLSESGVFLLVGIAFIVCLLLFCQLRRRKAWFES